MAKPGTDSDEPISDINIVPFVDIILVVLIIFMVTTPIIMRPSININLPKAVSGDESKPSQINVTVSSLGQIQLNGTNVDEASLGQQASVMFAQNPDMQAIISADTEVSHGKVVGVMDTLKAVGVTKFAFGTQKKK